MPGRSDDVRSSSVDRKRPTDGQSDAFDRAPRGRELSVREGLARINVDWSGSWQAARPSNWLGRSPATKAAFGLLSDTFGAHVVSYADDFVKRHAALLNERGPQGERSATERPAFSFCEARQTQRREESHFSGVASGENDFGGYTEVPRALE
jgi:hypothetical protein